MSEQRAPIWIPPAPSADARAVSVLHAGYLSKKGDRNMFSWKNRYFTLKSNGDLIYCENEASSQSLGSVPISAASVCSPDPKSPIHFTLQSAPQTRKYVLRSDTAEDCTLWMSKLSVPNPRCLCVSPRSRTRAGPHRFQKDADCAPSEPQLHRIRRRALRRGVVPQLKLNLDRAGLRALRLHHHGKRRR